MKITKNYKKIRKFMQLAGQEIPKVPTEPSDEVKILRIKLLMEELLETANAFGVNIVMRGFNVILDGGELHFQIDPSAKFDMVEAVDGLLDIEVVNRGAMIALGVTNDSVLQDEVSDNNLQKFGEGGYRRDDGKWQKPPNHPKPNIEGLLKEQGFDPCLV